MKKIGDMKFNLIYSLGKYTTFQTAENSFPENARSYDDRREEFSCKRQLTGFLMALSFLGLTCFSVYANDINVVAVVDRNKVELGSAFNFSLKIDGSQGLEPVKLPPIEGLESSFIGPSTRISIVNGQYSKSVSFNYNMYPIKIGRFEIPSLQIKIEGDVYQTQSIPIEVVDPGAGINNSQGYGDPGQSVTLQDKIFIVMGSPKNEYFINERIPITIKLLVNNLKVSQIQYPQFDHAGFTVEPFPEPPSYEKIIAGVRYNIWEFKTFVYPNRAGELTLGPAQLGCNMLFKGTNNRRRSIGSFGSIFDEGVFDGFFDTYAKKEVTLKSADLPFTIKFLPENGKPRDFSGGVGSFDFDVHIGPEEVRVGDPLTLKIKVAGNGNLKALRMPSMASVKGADENFKYYDPEIAETGRVKSLEQVVIPMSESVKEFPAIQFSFFDVAGNKYKTLRKGPFPVNVVPLDDDEQLKVVGLAPGEGRVEVNEKLGQDIGFINERLGKVYGSDFLLHRNAGFYVLIVLTFLLWGGCLTAYLITRRIKTDVKFARRLQAPRHARKGLASARKFLERDEQKDFYDALFQTLQKYFANKFHIPAGSVNIKNIERLVKEHDMEESLVGRIKSVFEDCEVVRYASIKVDKSKMASSFKQAEEIIDFFERKWR
ncbi:MAG: protein BatD [Candidatus Omnitrophica bacterium]|nr:protein BatD [Candidatus Omnitrophota bacterium]